VLSSLGGNRSESEAGDDVGIGQRTVQDAIKSCKEKLGAETLFVLGAWANELGLVVLIDPK